MREASNSIGRDIFTLPDAYIVALRQASLATRGSNGTIAPSDFSTLQTRKSDFTL